MPVGTGIAESTVEEALLEWFDALGYQVLGGSEIAPGSLTGERNDYRDVILAGRLRGALKALNPGLHAEVLDEAFRKVVTHDSPSLVGNNRSFHRMLVDGAAVETRPGADGVTAKTVRLVDFDDPEANDWLVVNQFSVRGSRQARRPDVLVFVNGIPLADIELKDPADEDATIWTAYDQIQTYKSEYGIPQLMGYNELCVVSDGPEARLGSLTAPKEWFLPWRTIEGEELASPLMTGLEVLTAGVFEKGRFLDLLRSFVVFEDDGANVTKKIAGYHQFHATRRAVETTLEAALPGGDRRGGVVWHTQGSGKSLTMAFFAGKLIRRPELENPTIVALTDRIDLDGQLFGVFSRCHELLRQNPAQAETRAQLRELLDRPAGGVVFTTIQKFMPEERGDRFPALTERRNVVVIADEAHRSQYDFIDGFAASTTSSEPSRTTPWFRSTTRAAWPSSISRRRRSRASTRASRRSPRARRSGAGRSSRRSGPRWSPWSAPGTGCR